MPLYRQEFSIREMDFIHAGEASINVKNILKEVGADPNLIRRVAIAAYEAEINVVVHGRDGRMVVELEEDQVKLIIEDKGSGIEDIELAMQEGFTTATPEVKAMGFGAGMGLPNIKKNADQLELTSEVGRGTRLVIIFWAVWESRKHG